MNELRVFSTRLNRGSPSCAQAWFRPFIGRFDLMLLRMWVNNKDFVRKSHIRNAAENGGRMYIAFQYNFASTENIPLDDMSNTAIKVKSSMSWDSLRIENGGLLWTCLHHPACVENSAESKLVVIIVHEEHSHYSLQVQNSDRCVRWNPIHSIGTISRS